MAWLLNQFAKLTGQSEINLASSLSRDEIRRKLRDSIDSEWIVFGGLSAFRGCVGDDTFRLRKRIWYNNSFQTHLRGHLLLDSRGTLIRCRAGMHPAVIAFLAVWFDGIALFATISLVSLLGHFAVGWPIRVTDTFGLLAGSIAMIALGIGLVRFGRWLARDEKRQLIEFLERCVSAPGQPSRSLGRPGERG